MGAEYRENARNAHKCAQKKYAANVESLQKFTQKRAVMCFGKFEEVRIKKEFLYTICAGAKNLDFPGKTELVDTITCA